MEEIKQKHPSQIQIAFYRCQSSAPVVFYGSDIKCNAYIMLEIKTSVKTRKLSNDYYFADDIILRARISPNQFAELLTTMNIGGGVPATLEAFFTKDLPEGRIEEPIEEDKTEIFKTEIDRVSKDTLQKLNVLMMEVDSLTISQKVKKSLNDRIKSIKQELCSHLPFIIDQAKEQVDNVVTAGKAAIDSFYTGIVTRLGIESLKDAIKVKMITKGDSSDE